MATTISGTEIARNFAAFVNRVAYRGERFLLVHGNKPVAELGPVPRGAWPGDLPVLLADPPRLSEEQARQFADDLDSVRAEQVGMEGV